MRIPDIRSDEANWRVLRAAELVETNELVGWTRREHHAVETRENILCNLLFFNYVCSHVAVQLHQLIHTCRGTRLSNIALAQVILQVNGQQESNKHTVSGNTRQA